MHRIILDTDLAMGERGSEIDDGFALALAEADPDIEVALITTVNGNTDVETATLLTSELVERLDRGARRIVRGAAAPLARPSAARSAPPAILEKYGHHHADPGHAASAIVDLVMANPGEITIVAIGPLTNLATALALDPRIAQEAREFVIMGGVFLGHTLSSSMPGEFNVWVDPEAAHAVLHSGARLRWVGLDVTLQVRLTRDHAAQMASSGGRFSSFAGEYTTAWIEHMATRYPGDPSHGQWCAMHDPLAVAALTRPELLTWKPAYVDIVTGDGIARGVMVTDLLTSENPPQPNCQIATAVEADQFMKHFLDMITSL